MGSSGCCTACDGAGFAGYELCSDCYGTGCAHPPPLCTDTEPCSEHRQPEGPNEDIGWCSKCQRPVGVLRPQGETYGLHADDCSLPNRHRGRCVGGGDGHPPAELIRGWWSGYEKDMRRAKEKWA